MNEEDKKLLEGLSNNASQEKSIYGIYTPEDVKKLHNEYTATLSINSAMRTIGTAIFRHHNIRALSQLTDGNDDEKLALFDKVLCEFCAIQSLVITKQVTRTKKLRHKAGDFKRDNKGNPIEKPNGGGYEVYKKDETFRITTTPTIPTPLAS